MEFKITFRFPHNIKPIVYRQFSSKEINKRQQQILDILAEGASLKVKDIQEKMEEKFSEKTLRRDLLVLKKMKFVNTTGYTHNAVWFIEQSSK